MTHPNECPSGSKSSRWGSRALDSPSSGQLPAPPCRCHSGQTLAGDVRSDDIRCQLWSFTNDSVGSNSDTVCQTNLDLHRSGHLPPSSFVVDRNDLAAGLEPIDTVGPGLHHLPAFRQPLGLSDIRTKAGKSGLFLTKQRATSENPGL